MACAVGGDYMLIGIDMVDIARIRSVAIRVPRFLKRVFTEQELAYCFSKNDPYPSLAARFAVREAVRKLDAVFVEGISFHDTEVLSDSKGKPYLILHNAALHRAGEAGISDWSISLSHNREQAIAVIIAKRGG